MDGAPDHIDDDATRRGPLAWMAKNIVAANLLMGVLLIGGFLLLPMIKQEVFPEFSLDMISISAMYPGASPEEVEEGVVLAIEEAVRGLDGVEDVYSTASEGGASVILQLYTDADPDQVLSDVRGAVDRITSFPVDLERPVTSLLTTRNNVLTLVIHGDLDERTLRSLAYSARDDLVRDENITLAEVTGVRPLEIAIEVPRENLSEYGVTLEQIAQIVARGSIDLPSGGIRTLGGEVLLRTTERREVGSEFEQMAVLSRPDGTEVTVADIGTVSDGFSEVEYDVYFDGQPASFVDVYRVGDQTPIEVSNAVHEFIESRADSLPPGVELTVWGDRSEIFKDRINLLLRNGYIGLILVLLTLGLFLEMRLAFWVTLGIPISFLGAIWFMPASDLSINMMSLFAFILTLGIVVDDAIIVGESIYHKRREGLALMPAAIAGVREVAGPVVFAVLTTMVAFLPLLFVPGVMGKITWVIPAVVIAVFFISLIESLFILPAHLAHSRGASPGGIMGWIHRRQDGFSLWFERFVHKYYGPIVRKAVQYRYLTLAAAFTLILLTAGFVMRGGIMFTFMPKVESDVVRATLTMPFGTSYEETEPLGVEILAALDRTFESLGSREEHNRGTLSILGGTGGGFGPRGGQGSTGTHLYQAWVYLVPTDERPFSAHEFAQHWRREVGEIAGAENLTFQFNIGPSAGSAIDIELSHTDVATLEAAATRLAVGLEDYDGVADIDDGFGSGKEQLDLRLRPGARAIGVTETDLARQLRSAFYGAEASRQQRGRDEIRVFVRLPEEQRRSIHDLEELLVRTRDGGEIPLGQAATIERGRAYTSIRRANGKRVLNVTADVEEGVGNATQIVGRLEAGPLPQLLADFPGLSYTLEGEQREQKEGIGALLGNFKFALFGIFGLLAIAFRSYVQPVIVMLAIPFGFVGAVWGHVVMGYDLSMLSFMGAVALSGIVVNDSLLLVVSANRYKAAGMPMVDACVAGGERRFRPILLTSLTTFFGLAPMILETSVQARFLIPMAVSLGFGVLFATFVTLFIVPATYGVIDDIRGVWNEYWDIARGELQPKAPAASREPEKGTPDCS